MSDIQYPETGKKQVKLKSTDLCGNLRNGVREVNIIQRLLAGQYINIVEDGDKATISADISPDYYNKHQINDLIGDLGTVKFKIVSALPAVGAENVIYLVPKEPPEVGYEQYIWNSDDSIFYPIGDTEIDLADYYTKVQADAKFQEKLSNASGISTVTDTTDFSQVSLGDKTVRQATGLSIWNYIKSKLTGAISTVVEDDVTGNRVLVSTPLGKVTTSSITSEELFTLDDIRSNVQEQIDDKLDKIVMGEETDIMVDTTPLTYLDVPNNETHVTRGSTIWTYIKSKLNVDNLTTVTDTTKIGSVDKSKTNVVQQFTASVLFQYMWKKIYPVGSIYTTITQDNPADLFGGTWEIVSSGRYLRGVGETTTAGTLVEQQLPNVKGQVSFASGSQGHPELSGPSGAFQTATAGNLTYPWPTDGTSGGARILRIDASRQTNSVYKDNGNVIPSSYTVHFWLRTA